MLVMRFNFLTFDLDSFRKMVKNFEFNVDVIYGFYTIGIDGVKIGKKYFTSTTNIDKESLYEYLFCEIYADVEMYFKYHDFDDFSSNEYFYIIFDDCSDIDVLKDLIVFSFKDGEMFIEE